MKLADKYLPMLSGGEYMIHITQSIETISPEPLDEKREKKGKDDFHLEKQFRVISRGFTLLQNDVFAVYPPENMQGDFAGELPFLVSDAKTLPWMYGDGRFPWVALIAIGEGDGETEEKEISIKELLAERTEGQYFPVAEMPVEYMEKEEDMCHIIDIPLPLFCDIMPKKAETEYLCHAKYTNLADTEEDVSARDGFFSVVMGNRFIPTGKTTMHLVSLTGYPDYDSGQYDGYTHVRLVSLYHWSVFCEPHTEADFKNVISGLDTGMMKGTGTQKLSSQGVCAKTHYLRSGDRTGSLFHSPFVSYMPQQLAQLTEPGYSADSVLIYYEDAGVFDITYAAAWQLGRMLALGHRTAAKAISGCRNEVLRKDRKKKIKRVTENIVPDYGEVCRQLIEEYKK